MLEIKNLQAGVEGNAILKGIDLSINAGEVHAIMGPNGSGKSTLAQVLAGREGYEITDGSVRYNGEDLLDLGPEERVREGFFLAFQYPVEIPGVNTTYFLRAAVNALREHRGEAERERREVFAFPRVQSVPPGKLVSDERMVGVRAGVCRLEFLLSMRFDDLSDDLLCALQPGRREWKAGAGLVAKRHAQVATNADEESQAV